jgi:hypothetical protein
MAITVGRAVREVSEAGLTAAMLFKLPEIMQI